MGIEVSRIELFDSLWYSVPKSTRHRSLGGRECVSLFTHHSPTHHSPIHSFISTSTTGLTMRAVVQRVSSASVRVAGEVTGQIGLGMLVLLGVAREDGEDDARQLADKIVGLRIFEDDEGKMNRSLAETGGAML